MANKRISQLPFVGNTGYTATDIMPIVNYDVTSGTTKHTPILDFKSYILSGLTDNYVTGATYSNGTLTIQQQGGNISVSGFTQPFTGNTSGDCITDLYISNLHGCSPITIHDSVQYTGSTALGVLSVAEGNQTIAYGDYSHTEGDKTRTGIYGAYLVDSIVDGVMTLNSSYGNIAFLGGCFGNEFAPSKVIIDDRDYDNSIGRGRYTVTGSSFDSLNTIIYLDDSSLNTTNAIILPFGSGDSPNPFDSIFDCWNGDQLMRGDYSHAEGEIQDPYLFGGGGAIGLHSHTEGLQGTSTGNYSHAEGVASSSLGIGSHAEGYKTTASGDYSHSEGFVTLANKDYSHSEGNFTWADGPSSHAEGVNTYSSGYGSHAEGKRTESSGDYSHTEGYETTASGYGSHAEGDNTTASGYGTHSEGKRTTASGYYTHAEGNQTTTSGYYTHTEGGFTTASGYYTHAEGIAVSAGFDPPNPLILLPTMSFDGNGSHAEGGKTWAYGGFSHAEGRETIALGPNSHSEGLKTIATGNTTHAEGWLTTTYGNYSHSEGISTTTGDGPIQLFPGDWNPTNLDANHAEGLRTKANGGFSHAEGFNTISSGFGSHAEGGYWNPPNSPVPGGTAIGNGSHAEGVETTTYGIGSHAEGNETKTGLYGAYLANSIVSGLITLNSSYGDVTSNFLADEYVILDDLDYFGIVGRYPYKIATVNYSILDGTTNIQLYDIGVDISSNFIVGNYSNLNAWYGDQILRGDYAHSEGNKTIALGYYSKAEGYDTSTGISGSTETPSIFPFPFPGPGTSSHAEGYGTYSFGFASHAEGSRTTASGYYTHSEGLRTSASGYGTHSEGKETTASGYYTHAEGFKTTTYGTASHAEGYGTVTNGAYQHAQGMWNVTGDTTQGALILGNGTDANNRSNLIFAAGNEVNISGKTITTNFQMTSGAINGYVLTSDVSGNASWQASTGGGGTFTYEIGQYVADEGGVIAHRWLSTTAGGSPSAGSFQNYLVVDTTDLSFGTTWGLMGVDVTNCESVWDGLTNTAEIISAGAAVGTAADLCNNSSNNGKTDWYLPAIDEFKKIWQNRWEISQGIENASGNQFDYSTGNSYWSSTEFTSLSAFTIYFFDGLISNSNKNGTNNVRAVRNFSI